MLIQFPVTMLVLVICGILIILKKNALWLVPHILTNSILGFLYMIFERQSLERIGTGVLGFKFKVSVWWNVVINILCHVAIPIVLLCNLNWKNRFDWKSSIFTEICGLLLIDVFNTYPTNVHSIRFYVTLHVFGIYLLTFVIAQKFQ